MDRRKANRAYVLCRLDRSADNAITLPAQLLRSSGVELIGSGLGSLSAQQILQSLTKMFAAVTKVHFAIDVNPVPLAKVEEAWTWKDDGRRIVFIP